MAQTVQSLTRFVKEIFTDSNGVFSSKRTVTLFCFLLIVIAFLCDLFTKFTVSEFMFDDMMYIVIAGLGLSATEPVAGSLFGNRTNSGQNGKPK